MSLAIRYALVPVKQALIGNAVRGGVRHDGKLSRTAIRDTRVSGVTLSVPVLNSSNRAYSEAQMMEIVLSNGSVSAVDDDDFDRLSLYSWCLSNGYVVTKIEGVVVSMHRLILSSGADQFVDHRDRNKLNNRKSNLRICTKAQNNINRDTARLSRFRGVHQRKRAKPWYAIIQADGQQQYLGSFASEEDAARAYDSAALRLHGEFAQLNFPPS